MRKNQNDSCSLCGASVSAQCIQCGALGPPDVGTELRVIGDHLGSIRDLLALISRQMEEARPTAPPVRISAAMIDSLQARTGYSLQGCKEALEKTNGDHDAAYRLLQGR